MIKVNPFTLDVLKTHKAFFLLDNLPKFSVEVDVWIKTPAGLESVDFIDVFEMQDGSILAAWKHPYQKLANHNLIAFCDGQTQILNLNNAERMINHFDKKVDSTAGIFAFSLSTNIPNGDWRCDRSMYGPRPFKEEQIGKVVETVNKIVFYEPFMGVNGVGHIMFLETTGQVELAHEKLNNSVVPVACRTFQECLRLMYEWSVLASNPFDATDDAARIAKLLLSELNFSDEEISIISNLPQMQIGQFISGSDNARKRPEDMTELTAEVENMLWRRMASSSLCFIIARNPNIWDFDSVLKIEQEELESGIARFREYYGIPDYEPLDENGRAVEFADLFRPKELEYIKNQIVGFNNKKKVIDKAIWTYNH